MRFDRQQRGLLGRHRNGAADGPTVAGLARTPRPRQHRLGPHRRGDRAGHQPQTGADLRGLHRRAERLHADQRSRRRCRVSTTRCRTTGSAPTRRSPRTRPWRSATCFSACVCNARNVTSTRSINGRSGTFSVSRSSSRGSRPAWPPMPPRPTSGCGRCWAYR